MHYYTTHSFWSWSRVLKDPSVSILWRCAFTLSCVREGVVCVSYTKVSMTRFSSYIHKDSVGTRIYIRLFRRSLSAYIGLYYRCLITCIGLCWRIFSEICSFYSLTLRLHLKLCLWDRECGVRASQIWRTHHTGFFLWEETYMIKIPTYVKRDLYDKERPI